MAVIHQNKNELESQIKRNRNKIGRVWLFAFIAMVIVAFIEETIVGAIIFIAFIISSFYMNKNTIIKRGLEGENRALNLLNNLPSNYHVFNNITVTHEGKSSELDLVIVGDRGIFVVEVKNHNGNIVGNEEERNWQQHKVGRKGGEYSKHLYNPTKQVGTHVFRLSKNLKKNGVHFWVQGAVFFSNPQVSIQVKTDKTPVFNSGDRLISYMKNVKQDRRLTKQDIQKVVNVLEKLSIKVA